MVVGKSPEWLPPGFIEKTKYKNGRKIRYYLNVETGTKYNSKKDVILATVDNGEIVRPQEENGDGNVLSSDNKADAVDNVDKYNVIKPNANESNMDDPNVNDPKIVDEPSTDMAPQPVSMTNTGGTIKKKWKHFVTVAVESSTDDDLPPGWIKEIKTSKSGNRTRKDPYYTDPISGYIFRSKLDALRFLETNDIGNCACKPLKRVLDGVKSEIPSSNRANEKFSGQKRQHLLGGELNSGEESSSTKVVAESEEQKPGNSESDSVKVTSLLEEKISCENSEKNAEMINNPETDPSTKQQPSESVERTKVVGSSKSKKRKELSLSSRISKRLAGSQPEMVPNSDLNERFLRAAARKPSASEVYKSCKDSATIPTTSDIGPTKEAEEQAFIGEETHQDPPMEVENPCDEAQKPPTENPSYEVEEHPTEDPLKNPCNEIEKGAIENLFDEVEKPPPIIQEEQLGGEASEKQIDESKQLEESQLCYDFGDSWSDPLEFALKTLRGDISIDDTLTFPSCFNDQINIPYEDGCLKQSQSDAPAQNDFASHSGSLKPQTDFLPTDLSFGCNFGGFNNCQDSTEVGKKDSQAKLNP